MLIIVSYDISLDDGQNRLRRVAKVCQDYGVRVQYSLFECHINSAQLVKMKASLLEIIDAQVDSLRFYRLGSRYQGKVEHYGVKPSFEPGDALFV